MNQSLMPNPKDTYLYERVRRLKNLDETYEKYNIQLDSFVERSLARTELDLIKLKGVALDVIAGQKTTFDLINEIFIVDFDTEAIELMKTLKIWEE